MNHLIYWDGACITCISSLSLTQTKIYINATNYGANYSMYTCILDIYTTLDDLVWSHILYTYASSGHIHPKSWDTNMIVATPRIKKKFTYIEVLFYSWLYRMTYSMATLSYDNYYTDLSYIYYVHVCIYMHIHVHIFVCYILLPCINNP